MKRILTALVIISLIATSCNFMNQRTVKGDGNVVMQNRNMSNFSSIDVSSSIDVYLSPDSAFSVQVEADQNLQEYIEVYMQGNVLHVRQMNNTRLDPSKHIKVFVSGKGLREFNVSGASKIIGKGKFVSESPMYIGLSGASKVELEVRAPSTRIELSGASTAQVAGETRDLIAEASGACDLQLFNLLAENTRVDISGATQAEVFASQELKVDASGASQVKYKGEGKIDSHTSGASGVKKVE